MSVKIPFVMDPVILLGAWIGPISAGVAGVVPIVISYLEGLGIPDVLSTYITPQVVTSAVSMLLMFMMVARHSARRMWSFGFKTIASRPGTWAARLAGLTAGIMGLTSLGYLILQVLQFVPSGVVPDIIVSPIAGLTSAGQAIWPWLTWAMPMIQVGLIALWIVTRIRVSRRAVAA